MATKWKTLSDAVATKLATITTGNGYQTSIGNKVFRWKLDDWDSGDMPGVAFRIHELTNATTKAVDPDNAMAEAEENDLTLEVVVATEGTSSTTPEATEAVVLQMVQDVLDAVRSAQKPKGAAWNGMAYWTSLTGVEVSMDKKEKIIGMAKLTFKVRILNKYLNAVN